MAAREALEVTPMVAFTATVKLPLTIGYIDSSSDGESRNHRDAGGGNDGDGYSLRGQPDLIGDSDTDIDSAGYYFRHSSSDDGVDFGITWTMMCIAWLLRV